MKHINEIIEELNNHYENMNSEKRYWIVDNNRYFVCYDALSDMSDINEVSEGKIRKIYEITFTN